MHQFFLSPLNVSRFRSAALIAGATLALASPGFAQDTPKLDVPYVPTPHAVVDKMLDMTQVSAEDYVVDLGSGDGRIAIGAAKRGAKAMGVDLNPVRVEEAKKNAEEAGVQDKVSFQVGDLFKTDFFDANVLTLYLYNSVNLKLRPVILEKMKPGTRVVSHAFNMGDWEPDEQAKVDGRSVYYWVVPAKVEGAWKVQNGSSSFDVNFTQSFQNLSGTATIDGKSVPISNGKLSGTQITFTIDGEASQAGTFTGRVEGDTIKADGTQAGDASKGDWLAKRAS